MDTSTDPAAGPAHTPRVEDLVGARVTELVEAFIRGGEDERIEAFTTAAIEADRVEVLESLVKKLQRHQDPRVATFLRPAEAVEYDRLFLEQAQELVDRQAAAALAAARPQGFAEAVDA